MLSAAAILRASDDSPGRVPSGLSPSAAAPLERDGDAVFARDTLFVLFDPALADAARLMETNLWEAAVMNVEAVDLRNFAHGRHLWAAKRMETLGILVLVTDATATLWRELDRELPGAIPRLVIRFDSDDPGLVLSGLWIAMLATNVAGQVKAIDPGKPGVPEFGRRIYHSPALLSVANDARSITPVDRKLAHRPDSGLIAGEWREAEDLFRERLSKERFDALVLDYDGTVVWSNARRDAPSPEIIARLRDMLDRGIPLGIATGRRDSVGLMLRSCLPEQLWPRVLVGYYNGGLCLRLDQIVDRSRLPVHEALVTLKVNLTDRCFCNPAAGWEKGQA